MRSNPILIMQCIACVAVRAWRPILLASMRRWRDSPGLGQNMIVGFMVVLLALLMRSKEEREPHQDVVQS